MEVIRENPTEESDNDPNCMDAIFEGKLYLGDKRSYNDLELLSRLSFTHILTAELVPVPMAITSRFPQIAILHVRYLGGF